MRSNPRINDFLGKLNAAGVHYRINWSTRRDGKPAIQNRPADLHHVSFIGSGSSPSVATAVMIDYGDRDGFGLYLDSGSNSIDADVARIAKPRDEAPVAPPAAHMSGICDDMDPSQLLRMLLISVIKWCDHHAVDLDAGLSDVRAEFAAAAVKEARANG
ncbi:hypothetical protein MesoLjLc_51280 [Mesorhizobium sp. L-8-10]|uniref:hypothetical protein n=1 Tax=Mesorhizobium sp. L-8-10 TaxID=2744523 RepID=UPI001929522D|nr:hypothetical protein [Mesorhizobium sp. L-8-10]BCH33198.1 hypothetical protein MesoLjLc_51280 [Mesorhizobium sp. L-8-10]